MVLLVPRGKLLFQTVPKYMYQWMLGNVIASHSALSFFNQMHIDSWKICQLVLNVAVVYSIGEILVFTIGDCVGNFIFLQDTDL